MTIDRASELVNLSDECNQARFHLEDAAEAINEGNTERALNLLDAAVDAATDVLAAIVAFRSGLPTDEEDA